MKQRGAVKVRKSGLKGYYSYLITIPQEVAVEMELKHGDYLGIESNSNTILLRKMKR